MYAFFVCIKIFQMLFTLRIVLTGNITILLFFENFFLAKQNNKMWIKRSNLIIDLFTKEMKT